MTGQDDAVLISKGKVNNVDVVVGAQDFRFIGGSFGAASGEAFIAGAQYYIENNIPYIFLVALADNVCMKVQCVNANVKDSISGQ